MYARKQSKWVKIRKTYGHSVQVDMYGWPWHSLMYSVTYYVISIQTYIGLHGKDIFLSNLQGGGILVAQIRAFFRRTVQMVIQTYFVMDPHLKKMAAILDFEMWIWKVACID